MAECLLQAYDKYKTFEETWKIVKFTSSGKETLETEQLPVISDKISTETLMNESFERTNGEPLKTIMKTPCHKLNSNSGSSRRSARGKKPSHSFLENKGEELNFYEFLSLPTFVFLLEWNSQRRAHNYTRQPGYRFFKEKVDSHLRNGGYMKEEKLLASQFLLKSGDLIGFIPIDF
ncbi:uncharacterized protein LOC135120089 [Zophobas morio]|uniref:uncharacterized protein LOC135120089 n=1 Tax=Zophobas morio TaxID=2755281 RepID=UPI0030833001